MCHGEAAATGKASMTCTCGSPGPRHPRRALPPTQDDTVNLHAQPCNPHPQPCRGHRHRGAQQGLGTPPLDGEEAKEANRTTGVLHARPAPRRVWTLGLAWVWCQHS